MFKHLSMSSDIGGCNLVNLAKVNRPTWQSSSRNCTSILVAKPWFFQTSRCFLIWNYIQPCFTFWNKIKLYFTWFKILKENFLPVISGRSRTFHVGSVPVAYLTLKTIYSKQNSNNYLQPKVFPLHISHIKNYLHSKVFQKLFT